MFSSKEAKETGRTTAQVETDKAITSRVEGELKEASIYKFPAVRAQTFNNVVQLSGFVSTEDQKRAAADIAQKTPGVRQVINNITLRSENPTPTGRTNEINEANPRGNTNANVPTANQPGSSTNAPITQ
jgi:hypothetical protein